MKGFSCFINESSFKNIIPNAQSESYPKKLKSKPTTIKESQNRTHQAS